MNADDAPTDRADTPGSAADDGPPSVLFVCTGNLCRSPLAAALLRRGLDEAGLTAHVSSAGTAAPIGLSPDRKQRRVAEELGVELDTHRAMPLLPRHLDHVDLVLTMTAEHTAAVVGLDAAVGGRTATLRAAAWKSRLLRGGPMAFADWVARLTHDVPVAERARADHVNDIPDPVGGPLREYRDVGAELDVLIATLVQRWSGR